MAFNVIRKNASKQLLIAALMAGTALAASAQTATPDTAPAAPAAPATQAAPAAPAPKAGHARMDPEQRRARMEQHRAQWQERQAKRLNELKGKLALKPAQEPAWQSFAAAQQPPQPTGQRPSREDFAKLTTPERLDLLQKRRAERSAQMDRRIEATRGFYAQLDTAQQKTFDAESLKMGPRGGMGGARPGHHPHHGPAAAPAKS